MTPNDVKALLDYDPLTGNFCWKVSRRGTAAVVGRKAGCKHSQGYWRIVLDGRMHYAHRLAWAIAHGVWPENIDHINGDKSDNRLVNLRVATRSQNMANRPRQTNNTSGFKGVYSVPSRGKWRARFKKDGRVFYLGYFDTAEEAAEAHRIAYAKAFGEYARAA